MIITPGHLSTLNSQNNFLTYKGLKDKNIVCLGSCRILSILTLIHICNIINTDVSIDFIKKISEYDFLESNATPIAHLDIERYDFSFKTQIFDNKIIKNKSFFIIQQKKKSF